MKPIIWKYGPLDIKEEPILDESTRTQQYREIRKNRSKFISKIPIDNDFDITLAQTYTKHLTEGYLQEFDRDHFAVHDKMTLKTHLAFINKVLKRSRNINSFTLVCFESSIQNIDLLKYALKALKSVTTMKIHFFLLSDQRIMKFWVHFISKILKCYKLTHLSFDIFIRPLIIPNLIKLLEALTRIKTLESLNIDLFSTLNPVECTQFPQVLQKISLLLQKNSQFKHFALNIPGPLDKYENELIQLWSSLKNEADLESLKITIYLQNYIIKEKMRSVFAGFRKLTLLDITVNFHYGVGADIFNFFQSLNPTIRSLQMVIVSKSSEKSPSIQDWQSLGKGLGLLKFLEDLSINYQSERSEQEYLRVLAENIGNLSKLKRLEIGADGDALSSKTKVDLFIALSEVMRKIPDINDLGFEFHVRDSAKRFKDEGFGLFLEELKRFAGLTNLKLNFGETSCTDQALEGLKNIFKHLQRLQALEIDIGSRKFTNKGLIDFGKGIENFQGEFSRVRFCFGGGKIRKGVKRLLKSFVRILRTKEVEITIELCNEGIEDSYEDIFDILKESNYSKFWKLDIFDF